MMATGPTGGDLLAQTLRRAGVTQVFALHGGHLEALLKGCVENDIAMLDFRHEAAAGHAADAYARATAGLGVCFVTAGPGIANAMPAVTNAYLDGSPVLFIIGAPPLREAETNPLQGGFDQIAALTPVTKWAHRITNTERIPDLTAMAIRHAMSGRRGPVVLELPIDVLHMPADPRLITNPTGLSVAPRAAPTPEDADAVLRMLAAAERPCIVVGGDACQSQCGAALRAFAEATGIPVFANSKGAGLLPSDHPLSAGSPAGLALLTLTNQPRPDAMLVLGARFGMLLGGRGQMIVPPDARVAQVYSDPAEIGRIRDVDVAIAADSRATLEALLRAAGELDWRRDPQWIATATALQTPMAQLYPEPESAAGIHPFHAARAVMEVAGPGAGYVFDGGEAASWGGDAVQVDGPGRVLGHGYLGCLGIGPGFAIGLQRAFPERRVVQVTGDGAMGFHIQEFDTMVRHGLPIVTVVFNNQVWGMSIHGQQIMFGGNYAVISRLGGTHYANIAAGFGCHAERVDHFADLKPALERAFAAGVPAMVEVMTDAAAVHPITVAMLGQAEEGSSDIVIPYYENIPGRVGA
jgi:acetolactate synthase-1/2/3 large subunit